MKRLFGLTLLLVALATMSSCHKEEEEDVNKQLPPTEWELVEFNMLNAYQVTAGYEDMETRATLDDASCGYLYCFVDGELELTQVGTDENFGLPTLSLTYGEHQIQFVASVDPIAWNEGIGTPVSVGGAAPRVRDSFGKVLTLNVDANTPVQNVHLDRVISQIKVYVDDALPSNIGSVEISIDKHYMSLSHATLCGAEEKIFTNTWDISAYAGVSGANFTLSSYVPNLTNEWLANVTIRFKSNTGALLHERTTAINLLCNRRTVMHGTYKTNGRNSIEVNSEWIEEKAEKW